MTAKVFQARQAIGLLDPTPTANRVVATADGATMALQTLSAGMVASGVLVGRGATKLVAAVGASAGMKAVADYVCDGNADDLDIGAALAALPASGGTVVLSEGTFTLAGPIVVGAGKTLRGQELTATILKVVDNGGGAINTQIVSLTGGICGLADLTIDGNRGGGTNASQDSMMGLYITGSGTSAYVRRVRVRNSSNDGVVIYNVDQPITLRECLVDSSDDLGIYVSGHATQSVTLVGCSVTGGIVGYYLDVGVINVSDCTVWNPSFQGFDIRTNAKVSLSNCTAEQCGAEGFRLNGTVDAALVGCRTALCAAGGFGIQDTSRVRFEGCLAAGPSSGNIGFAASGTATDTVYQGCTASGFSYAGFWHNANGRSTYLGCAAIGNTSHGFYIGGSLAASVVTLDGCSVVGLSTSSHGIYVNGGAHHAINGCRIANNGAAGIGCAPPTTMANLLLSNNILSDNSLTGHGAWPHIYLPSGTNDSYIAGNSFEIAASGNRASYAIQMDAGALGNYVGQNDYTNGFFNGVVYDNNTTLTDRLNRRTVKQQLNYACTADPWGGTVSVSANVWTDIIANQSFRIDSLYSLVEVACGGFMIWSSAGHIVGRTRVVIDDGAIIRQFSCEYMQNAFFQNPLSGGHVLWFQQLLTPGVHTIRMQMAISATTSAIYLRGSTNIETLRMVVTEYAQ